MLTVAVPKRNKLQNIIVLTPKDGYFFTRFVHVSSSYTIHDSCSFVKHILWIFYLLFPTICV